MSDVTIENNKESSNSPSKEIQKEIDTNKDSIESQNKVKITNTDDQKLNIIDSHENGSDLLKTVKEVLILDGIKNDQKEDETENTLAPTNGVIDSLVDIKDEPCVQHIEETKNIIKSTIKSEVKISQKILTKNDLKGDDSDQNSKFDSNISNSSDSEQCSGSETDMRIGDDYQAVVPDFTPSKTIETINDSIPMWKPTDSISSDKLSGFIQLAKDKYNYRPEQSLGMLMYHNYDIEKTLQDLMNFSPMSEEWSAEDKVIFSQAFSFHGKSFHRIRQMLPDKPHSSLIKFYYSWKKTKSRMSALEKNQRKIAFLRDSKDKYDDDVCAWLEHNEPKIVADHPFIRAAQRKNGAAAAKLHAEIVDRIHHTASKDSRANRNQPKGMNLERPELTSIAYGPTGTMEAMLQEVGKDYHHLMVRAQGKKQNVEKIIKGNEIKDYSKNPKNLKIIPKWTPDDLMLAVEGVREYGKDFESISRMMGNKTESHLRSFFMNHRRRFNLDRVFQEHELNNAGDVNKVKKVETVKETGEEFQSLPKKQKLMTSVKNEDKPDIKDEVQFKEE